MEINLERLKQLIEKYAKPRWNKKDEEWPLRKGGGEEYLQDIFKKVAPFLKEDNIAKDSKLAVINALNKHVNLLGAYDIIYATAFINQVDEDSFKSHIINYLYGPENVEIRLRRFLEWAAVKQIQGESKKKGFNLPVASYLLAMTNPNKYPFCKPSVYNKASNILIGEEAKKSDPVEKWIVCREFYSRILGVLEREYGLVNGNLLDVHSILYLFKDKLEKEIDAVIDTQLKMRMPKNDQIRLLYELLLDKYNVVLYGPPGTGKTRIALQLAGWWKENFGENTVYQLTFHPSYYYEDFMEGFRPTSDGRGFEIKEGIFKEICKKASTAKDEKFLLIIDEINRGDVARIFGELITLIEGDKRGPNFSIILPASKESFSVPDNLFILGTMNTADKSISLIDLAIRRRFLFYALAPDPSVLEDSKELLQEIEGIRLSQLLIRINQRLMEAGIDKDRSLGHSYFIIPREKKNALELLKNRFKYEIYPLLEEYCCADRSLIEKALGHMVNQWGELDEDIFESDDKFIECLRTLIDSK